MAKISLVAELPGEADVSAFFSYRHTDNEEFNGVVERLRQSLQAQYEASTGKVLRIFVDREGIGWGDNWREQLEKHLRGAMVFVPIITMRYFKSTHCCDELMTFHRNAQQLGVTELLLPLILMGKERITEDHAQEEVRLIAGLQHRPFEDAWIAGPDSREWRSAVADLVESLDHAMIQAEARLALPEHEPPGDEPPGLGPEVGPEPDPKPVKPSGDIELDIDVPSFLEKTERIAALLEEMTATLEEFSSVANERVGDTDFEQLTPGQLTFRLGAIAEGLKRPSLTLSKQATDLRSVVADTDVGLRQILHVLEGIHHPSAQESLAGLRGSLGEMSELGGPLAQTDELISVLKMVGLMDVRVRKALQPAVRGLQDIKVAMSTVHGWQRLAG